MPVTLLGTYSFVTSLRRHYTSAWSVGWTGAKQGLWAALDGANPFGNPLANRGFYNPSDPDLKISKGIGTYVVAPAATIATGAAIWQAAGGATVGVYGNFAGVTQGVAPHFSWTVTTATGTTAAQGGFGTAIIAQSSIGIEVSTPLVTGIPAFFPQAAALTTATGGVTSMNCFTAACAAVRRGLIGF